MHARLGFGCGAVAGGLLTSGSIGAFGGKRVFLLTADRDDACIFGHLRRLTSVGVNGLMVGVLVAEEILSVAEVDRSGLHGIGGVSFSALRARNVHRHTSFAQLQRHANIGDEGI